MKRPVKHTHEYYDYHECRDYLESKHDYNERDYAGWLDDKSLPYQDFWHFVCDMGDISNDSPFTMCEWWGGEGAADWQVDILDHYLDEFGEGEPGERMIEFYVSW